MSEKGEKVRLIFKDFNLSVVFKAIGIALKNVVYVYLVAYEGILILQGHSSELKINIY